MKKLNCNLSEEEDSSRWSKILGLSYEDKNGLAEIEKFWKGNMSNSFNNEINKHTYTWSPQTVHSPLFFCEFVEI